MTDDEKLGLVTSKNEDDFKLIPTEKPFEITKNLKCHLLKYTSKYGMECGTGDFLFTDVWCIIDKKDNECGYAWWGTPKEKLDVKIITIAVFDEYQGNGAASIAIDFLIDEATKIEIKQLRAQVHFIRNDMEQRVVNMLCDRGFELADKNYRPKKITNFEEYLQENYTIIYLIKSLMSNNQI